MSDPLATKTSIEIGLRIKKLVAENYKTASDCSRQLGVSPGNWSKVVAGRVRFDSEKIYRLAEFFNVSPSWLLTGEGEMLRTNQSPHTASLPSTPEKLREMARFLAELADKMEGDK